MLFCTLAGEGPASPASAVKAAHADLAAVAAADEAAAKLAKDYQPQAPFYRYLWVSTPEKHRDDFLVALALQLNLLSVQGKLYLPTLVAPDVVRIDVRHYGWVLHRRGKLERNVLPLWEKFAEIDPFFHQRITLLEDATFVVVWPGGPDPKQAGKEYKRGKFKLEKKAGRDHFVPGLDLPAKEIEDLRCWTYSEAPVLMAEWWFVQTARQVSLRNVQEGVGYYDWLGLKSRKDFFALTGADEDLAKKLFRSWREVVRKSGISQQNRQVFALGSASGRVWGTYDTFKQQGAGVAARNLRDGEFAHDAEEWYGFLPNGLWVTFLSDKAGVAQESAPDKIGPDKSAFNVGNDGRVHANLSCIRCHGVDKDFLKPVNGWAKKAFRQGGVLRIGDKDKEVLLELEGEYLRDLDEALDDDRRVYLRAVRALTASKKHPKGLTAPQLTKLYCEAWNRYAEADVSLDDAAREIGVAPEALQKGIKAYAVARGGTDLVLSAFIDDPPDVISRLDWEDSVRLAVTLAAGVIPPEQPKKEKAQ